MDQNLLIGQAALDAQFVEIVGRIGLLDLAAYGSAELGDND